MLELDHRHVEALLGELADSEECPAREQLLADLESSLDAHMKFEEWRIYPLVEQVMGVEPKEEATNEHQLARDGLATLRELATQPGFGGAVEALKGGITHHVEEEESEIFPGLRSQVDADEQQSLGHALLAAKRDAGLPLVPAEETKEHLLKLANDLRIAGRSAMDRDALAEAIMQSS